MSSISVGVCIPPNLYEKLLAHASKLHVSKSEVVISALAHYLNSVEDIPLGVKVGNLEKRIVELEKKLVN